MNDATETRLQRGLVAQALHAQYPHPLTELALEHQVQQIILDRAHLDRALAYLEEKGFVKRTETRIANRTIRAYQLTAAGVDLVDTTIRDAGIELG